MLKLFILSKTFQMVCFILFYLFLYFLLLYIDLSSSSLFLSSAVSILILKLYIELFISDTVFLISNVSVWFKNSFYISIVIIQLSIPIVCLFYLLFIFLSKTTMIEKINYSFTDRHRILKQISMMRAKREQ